MLLYHVHLDVPDVPQTEGEYLNQGFRLLARFGYVGRDHRRFEPDVSWDDLKAQGVRLRLVELERGAVNVVLMRSRFEEPHLGQIGFSVSSEERRVAVERAKQFGLRVRDEDVRLFVSTNQRFDLEFSDHERYRYEGQQLSELQLDSLEAACSNPAGASGLSDALLQPDVAARISFVQSEDAWASLKRWHLATGSGTS